MRKLRHSADVHLLTCRFKMTAILSKFVTETLCDNLGGLDLESLNATVSKSFTVADSVLRSVLFDDARFAIGVSERAAAGERLGPDSLVVARTSLRLCQVKSGQCRQCSGLHLCRFVVCGQCRFG